MRLSSGKRVPQEAAGADDHHAIHHHEAIGGGEVRKALGQGLVASSGYSRGGTNSAARSRTVTKPPPGIGVS